MAEGEKKFWDSFWAKEGFSSLRAHSVLISASENALGSFSGKRTLEVGSGRGVDSIEMARRGAICHIVDFSTSSFDLSLALAGNSGIEVLPYQADAEQLPFADGEFDLVFSQGLMEHPGLMRRLLPEQTRVTKPGGLVLIDVPQLFSIQAIIKWIELQIGKWPFGPEVNFTEKQLRQTMESLGLKYVCSYGRELIPIVNLGIRRAIAKMGQQASFASIQKPVLENLPAELDFATRFSLSTFGPKVLNNVGVIAQKPEI
ncbi:MAG TPA: class I SAM-dependent methyltransferase [Candidatus Bathyarchaeia archaeon]|nr:class I SAM-dependent methyltransferase [Candidatus Bathyarchaeia archaeon]